MDQTFIKRLREIRWDELLPSEARDFMEALREAQAKGEEWFAGFAAAFAAKSERQVETAPPPAPRRGRVGKSAPRTAPRAEVQSSEEAHPPVTLGGEPEEVRRVPLMPNSYLSKEGPRGDMPMDLPPDHPRNARARAAKRVAGDPDVDAAEKAVAEGRSQDLFN